MLRAALTGGIATGKSFCLSRFAALGAAVIDADALAREAVRPGRPAWPTSCAGSARACCSRTARLDRAALGRLVFTDRAARADLEAIVHPLVYQRIGDWFADLPAGARVAIADIPLLFETATSTISSGSSSAPAIRPSSSGGWCRAIGCRQTRRAARLAAQWPIDGEGARERTTSSGPTGRSRTRTAQVAERVRGRCSSERADVSTRQRRLGVLGRRDALLDEGVPLVAVRALPQQLGAAVAAADADVRIEVEDRVARQIDVAIDERLAAGAGPTASARSPGAARARAG